MASYPGVKKRCDLLGIGFNDFFIKPLSEYHVANDISSISTGQYFSNWELSASRAAAVVRLLVASGLEPTLISAEGYAHYRPVTANDTKKGRAFKLRVEIVYERDAIARSFAGMKNY